MNASERKILVNLKDTLVQATAGLEALLQPPSTIPLLNQRDPRWAGRQLGTSNKTIGSHGCAITCLSMLLRYYGMSENPATVNHQLKLRNGYYNSNLLIWESVQRIWPRMDFQGRVNCLTRPAPVDRLRQSLAMGRPVIAWLDGSPSPGMQQHFVLLVEERPEEEDWWCHDPWTGERVSLVERFTQDVPGKPWLLTAPGIIMGLRFYRSVS